MTELAKPPFFVANSWLCGHCRNLTRGSCFLLPFYFKRFLGHVACWNLPWQDLNTDNKFYQDNYDDDLNIKTQKLLPPSSSDLQVCSTRKSFLCASKGWISRIK